MALVISDRCWHRELNRGKRCFSNGHYQQAILCFYRAAQHAESARYLRTHVDRDTPNAQLLHCAYQWLSDAFAALDDVERQSHYRALARSSLNSYN